jgi:hypothetical protein
MSGEENAYATRHGRARRLVSARTTKAEGARPSGFYRHPETSTRWAPRRPEVRDKLDQASIAERVFFPGRRQAPNLRFPREILLSPGVAGEPQGSCNPQIRGEGSARSHRRRAAASGRRFPRGHPCSPASRDCDPVSGCGGSRARAGEDIEFFQIDLNERLRGSSFARLMPPDPNYRREIP